MVSNFWSTITRTAYFSEGFQKKRKRKIDNSNLSKTIAKNYNMNTETLFRKPKVF